MSRQDPRHKSYPEYDTAERVYDIDALIRAVQASGLLDKSERLVYLHRRRQEIQRRNRR